jgi:actin-like ATPase involved in cell morphogenesis
MRNVYVPITEDDVSTAQMADVSLDYVEKRDEDGDLELMAVVGEDAFKLANIFNSSVKRPMKDGVISSTDVDALDVMGVMWKKLVDKKIEDGLCTYSIPAESIDRETPPIEYHERVFERIFKSIGFKHVRPVNEALAITFSEAAKEKFTALSISFGSGMINVCLSYKGTPTIKFSLARSGDWIDESVGKSLNLLPNKVASVKENELDLLNPSIGNKKTKKIREALCFYYENLIEYAIKNIVQEFKEKSDGLDIDENIPIILSGGTSLPKNFDVVFENIFSKYKEDFPYEVLEIRRAVDPLSAVAKGCLIYAHWIKKKENL